MEQHIITWEDSNWRKGDKSKPFVPVNRSILGMYGPFAPQASDALRGLLVRLINEARLDYRRGTFSGPMGVAQGYLPRRKWKAPKGSHQDQLGRLQGVVDDLLGKRDDLTVRVGQSKTRMGRRIWLIKVTVKEPASNYPRWGSTQDE